MADNLPVDVALDIFSRLPAEKVLDCRRVCKTWRNHLSSLDKTNFAAMHLQHIDHHHDRKIIKNGVVSKVSTQGLIFLIRYSRKYRKKKMCHPISYGEYDDEYIRNKNQKGPFVQTKLKLINHSIPRKEKCRKGWSSLVGSCNGLICLAEPIYCYPYVLLDPILICNPITREHLYLPGLMEIGEYPAIYSGFGHCSQTNKYKVVRIMHHIGFYTIQVYTLGDGSGWRNKGVINNMYLFNSETRGVFFNGAIYWLGWNGSDVRVFNLSDETFHDFPRVPVSNHISEHNILLGTYGECLCVTDCKTRIWTYKKTSLEKSIADTDKDEPWSWCKKFSNIRISCTRRRPFAVTKNGLILFMCYHNWKAHATLVCYDPRTANMKKLGIWNSEVILHTNSFVSLKALGETCQEIQ